MKDLKLVFSDFDGTLTHEDELTPQFFKILSFLKSKNIPLVIVTGRSKSWAHFLLSHIHDLNHVITEGGGNLTSVTIDDKGRRVLSDHLLIEKKYPKRLEVLTKELLQLFPGLELSVDSFGRETDRAIELSWLAERVEAEGEIREFFRKNEVNYSTSNVHMNFWCGEISKSHAMDSFLSTVMPQVSREGSLFFGDSLNDESVFKDFPNTVGVANIEQVKEKFRCLPSVILEGKHNEGPYGVLNYLESLLK